MEMTSEDGPMRIVCPELVVDPPKTGATLRLLRAVEAHRPYAYDCPHACMKAWKRVHRQVWQHKREGRFDVEEFFYQCLREFRRGQFPIASKSDTRYQLMAAIDEDVARCENGGRSRIHVAHIGSLAGDHDDDTCNDEQDQNDPTPTDKEDGPQKSVDVRRSKRLRAKSGTETDRRRRKARTEVDRASDEKFLELLLDHVPHRATNRAAAWTRVLDMLSADNALSNRWARELVKRYDLLVEAMDNGTPRQREKLTPSIKRKLRKYRALVAPAVKGDEVELMSTSRATVTSATHRQQTPSGPPPSPVVARGCTPDEAIRREVLTFVADAVKDAHHEILKRLDTIHLITARLSRRDDEE